MWTDLESKYGILSTSENRKHTYAQYAGRAPAERFEQFRRPAMLKRLDHVGIVVDDLAKAKRLLGEVLGLSLVREVEVLALERRAAFYQCGDASIEVIEDLNAESKVKNLRGGTAHIEHIAVEVDAVTSVLAALGRLGVKVDSHGIVRVGSRLNAWTDPDTTQGIMFQFLSSAPE
jgi:methylmalonyl-CoA/ethylmalonyl-CoA epimerase